MGDMDPEDTKSLDSSDGAVQAGEENHSSNSDMVHLEREEAEMLEEAEEDEDDDLQSSVLSVLGGERELVELREEEEMDLQAPETEGLLVSAEEPIVEKEPAEFMQVVPPMALPPLPIVRLHPPSTTSTPIPSITTSEAEEPYITEGLHPPFIFAPTESPEHLKFSQVLLSDVEEHSAESSEAATEKSEPQPSPLPKTSKPQSSTKLLIRNAALVAVVGIVAYGAIAYCRK
ncbi:bcl-2-like protein 13 [Labrus mixtus]|uniref:bcl-2-like protein 13 n=1 Tax=Labrus mixtus TaxID=508554 RepID=UPI0029BFBCD3|nr:bcl-2-like protein 13 [Labrus mixtus]